MFKVRGCKTKQCNICWTSAYYNPIYNCLDKTFLDARCEKKKKLEKN